MLRMRAEQRRAQVLRCAIEVFAERGYHRASISDIVERANIARGTFYQYFGDKRSIFEELLDAFMHELRERIVRIDPSVGLAEGMTLLRGNIRRSLELMLERRALTKILLSDAVGLDPDFDQKLLDFYTWITTLLERSLVLGQELGYVRAGDVHLKAIFVLGALKELMYHVCLRGYDPDPERLTDQLVAHVRDGLLAPEAADAG
jgi:AcrR family transcriptional regulator